MQAARRLYLYAMSGITLGVIAIGVALLLQVVLRRSGLLPEPYEGFYDDPRQQVSQAIAMLGVGVPVWAVHWWLIQRALRPDRPDRDAERNSAIRAVYLALVLSVLLILWVTNAENLVRGLATDLLDADSQFNYLDLAQAGGWAIVGFGAWLYHGIVRRADLRAGPVHGAAAWVPRLYLYGVALVALVIALLAVNSLVQAMVYEAVNDEAYARFLAIESAVSVLAWGLVWFGHWRYAAGLVRSDDWRGAAERVSRTRIAALVATIVVTAGYTVVGVAWVFQALLAPLFPEIVAEGNVPRRIGLAIVGVVPWALAWWAHARALRREPAAADPLRALHQVRLETHGVAAVALAAGATGLGWLAGMGIDIALGGTRRSDTFGAWEAELSLFLPLAVVGLGTWAWFWRLVLARRGHDPVGEANSTIRRTFLYLTLAVALVVALASAALILYRFVGSAIGAAIDGNAVSALSTPLGALMAALLVLAYHGLLLRADQALKPAAAPVLESGVAAPGATAPGAVVAEAPVPSAAAAILSPGAAPAAAVPPLARPRLDVATLSERRAFELVGPEGADLEAALAAAREALPPGFEIVPRGS